MKNQLNIIAERGYGNENRDGVKNYLASNVFATNCKVKRTDNGSVMTINDFLNQLKLHKERVQKVKRVEKSAQSGKIKLLEVTLIEA